MNRALVVAATIASFSACQEAGDPPTAAPASSDPAQIVRGTEERGLPQVVLLHEEVASASGVGVGRCSGTYVAPRLVLTAAHCLRPNVIASRFFVYWGDDYWTDKAQLPAIPPPGQPSKWARVEGWLQHPDYDPNLHYPDVALLYLDRPLPFAPLPIYPLRVTDAWVGKYAELAGWGGSKALTADITQVEGSGVKRSGRARIAGSPTEADYHPDDPNAGVLDPEIRRHLLKTDGAAPSANACAGDSGGPLLLDVAGTKWVAGVSDYTGLWCEDYGLYLRLETFLPFIAEAFRSAGLQPVTPALDCVDARDDGTLRAYFGYANENRLSVTVPYGPLNRLPQDRAGARLATFSPGTHTPAFGVSFAPGEHLDYQLRPLAGPVTRLRIDETSLRCEPGPRRSCLRGCEAMTAARCDPPVVDALQGFDACVRDCVDNVSWMPEECVDLSNAWYECVGRQDPADPASWTCDDFAITGTSYASPTGCQAENEAIWACLGW